MRRTGPAPFLALALGLAACSLPESAFQATPDAGSGPGSGMTDVLAIVVSSPAIDVDEGATTDFTVQLNHAPGAPLEIDLSAASQKIGLSMQKLFFDANNFAQGQTVTVTGVVDDDTATELAQIVLSGAGVADLMVGATVHDPDKVTIVADITDGATVNEGKSKDVHVHLSHRPPGDVAVSATMSSGPMTVSPPSQVFHMDDGFSTDVTFTLSAPVDQNVANESQTITFAIAGGDQRIIQVTDVDKDSLSIQTSPQSISHLLEGDGVTLNLTLSLQPASDVTVQVGTRTGKAQISATSVTFKAAGTDYMTNHPITITAPQDDNTTPETDTIVLTMLNHPEVTAINIPVQIDDDDVQSIQTTVINSLTVTEGMARSFGVTLKFAPIPGSPVTVNLSTADPTVATAGAHSTGANFLTFTDMNYNDPAMHQVDVQGTQDSNLVTNSTTVKLISGTLETDVAVDVLDDDTEAFTLSQTTSLTIPEGTPKTFTVALAFQPTAAVHVMLTSTNSTAVPVSPATLDFSTTNWQTPQTVTLSPPTDTNNVSESATISVIATGIPTATLMVTVMDATQINSYGYPAPPAFGGSFAMQQGQVIAYKVTVPNSTLDTMSVNVPTASADFRMALYTDNGNTPGALVNAAQFLRRTLVNGANTVDIADVPLTAGSYWIALRIGGPTGLSAGDASQTGVRCTRTFNINSLDDAWPVNFGTADCVNTNLFNFWMTTYHQ
ncbi:MAG TPA: hypothetical protein VHT91_48300 [Kofleriaceae bacterium]|jgi:hypothetical protein|nr:hypothetical protein [Kofleriaceae bacterium]